MDVLSYTVNKVGLIVMLTIMQLLNVLHSSKGSSVMLVLREEERLEKKTSIVQKVRIIILDKSSKYMHKRASEIRIFRLNIFQSSILIL